MLWSRRSVFLAILLGGPVVLAALIADRDRDQPFGASASTVRASAAPACSA